MHISIAKLHDTDMFRWNVYIKQPCMHVCLQQELGVFLQRDIKVVQWDTQYNGGTSISTLTITLN